MEAFDIQRLSGYREGNRLEAKAAREGLPRSLWEMFSLIDIGERAGTGILDVFAAWAEAGLPKPQIEERFGEAERTIVTLPLEQVSGQNRRSADLMSAGTDNKRTKEDAGQSTNGMVIVRSADNETDNNDNNLTLKGLGASERSVLSYIAAHRDATQEEVAAAVGIGRTAVANHTSSLQKRGLLKRVGSRKTGHWEVLGDDAEGGE